MCIEKKCFVVTNPSNIKDAEKILDENFLYPYTRFFNMFIFELCDCRMEFIKNNFNSFDIELEIYDRDS